jgi:rare lipoprotein A
MENGKSTVVRVNDRGPFHEDRLIDLSVAAAIQLGFYEKGLARVKVEIVESQLEKIYALEVGEFNEQRTAREFMDNMRGLISSGAVLLSKDVLVNSKYVVRIGPVQKGDELDRLEALVKLMDVPSYRLVPIDFRNDLNKVE